MAKKESKVRTWLSGLIGALCLVVLVSLPVPAKNDREKDLTVRFENELIVLINAQREKSGLAPLTLHLQLKALARAHCADMACNGHSSHTRSDGSSTRDRVTAQGYQFVAVGENIAAGCETPREVIALWMKSPGHRKNMLDPSFTEMGVGYLYDPKSRYGSYWTALFGCRSK